MKAESFNIIPMWARYWAGLIHTLPTESAPSTRVERKGKLPTAEKLGGLTDLNRTKKAAMDTHQYSLRG